MNEFKLKIGLVTYIQAVLFVSAVVGVVLLLRNQLFLHRSVSNTSTNVADEGFGWKFPKSPLELSGGQVSESDAYSRLRSAGGVPRGLPVRLKIPIIGVDSLIEDAAITPDGRMDVPAGSVNVAWFALGPRPGQIGSAVIGGHFGIKDGKPFVFYSLDKLKVGDRAYIVDDKGNTLTFVVRSIKLFDRNADARTVFTSTDGLAHLNLITCEGVWNKVNDSYPDRRVVFTDEISTTPSSSGKPKLLVSPAAFADLGKNDLAATATPTPVELITTTDQLFGTPLRVFVTTLILVFIILITYRILRGKK